MTRKATVSERREKMRRLLEDVPGAATRPRGRPRGRTAKATGSRACHDCGAPTTDYRCRACRAAWRIRHGVAVCTQDEEIL